MNKHFQVYRMALSTTLSNTFQVSKLLATKADRLNIRVRYLKSKQLYFGQFGEPLDVVKVREVPIPALKNEDVLVRMLAAPVNPSDINTIQGKYPVKLDLPAIPGNEGMGVVEELGPDVKDICRGDKVIVTKPTQGTWRNIAVFNKGVLKTVPKELDRVKAATVTINPCTAYRMLTDFVNVKDNGVVIQNGANGACGQNVIQICKAWGVPNINIVRNRPDINDLKEYLLSLGATFVLTEEEVKDTTIFKDNKIDKPALALNCVGGKNATAMCRHLKNSGMMVTYGGMSKEPVTIPTGAFIFKNISFCGFWMTAWNEKAVPESKNAMINDIIDLMCQEKLKEPRHKMVKFNNYQEAVANTLSSKGFTGCKYILDFSE